MGNTTPYSIPPQDEDAGVRRVAKQPFEPWSGLSSTSNTLQDTPRGCSPLQHLILSRDWQRVLCRISIFPNEVRHYCKFKVGEHHAIQVLPLHLACAMDPPLAVVELMIQLYADSATLPIKPSRKLSKSRRKFVRKALAKYTLVGRKRARKRTDANKKDLKTMQMTFSQSDDGNPHEDAQQSLLESHPATVSPSSLGGPSINDDCSVRSGPLSTCSSLSHDGAILQLSPTDSKQPTPFHDEENQSQQPRYESFFRVQWDLEPLFHHITDTGSLLPLHVACIYSANQDVLRILLDSYPAAALTDVLGMLPIHWVAAGWVLPPLFQPEARRPDLALQVLQRTVPDSVRIRSGSHGMTPAEYIHECMEESSVKVSCLHIVESEADDLSSYDDSIIFGGSETSDEEITEESTACIRSLIAEGDWEVLLVEVERDSSVASKWIFGLDEAGPSVWKRLPIHLACANQAPVGLIALLLRHFPEGAMHTDPRDGSTPLHIACESGASESTIKLLVSASPGALRIRDNNGRLPLHLAILRTARLEIIKALVVGDPVALLMKDANNKLPSEYAEDAFGRNYIVQKILDVSQVSNDDYDELRIYTARS